MLFIYAIRFYLLHLLNSSEELLLHLVVEVVVDVVKRVAIHGFVEGDEVSIGGEHMLMLG